MWQTRFCDFVNAIWPHDERDLDETDNAIWPKLITAILVQKCCFSLVLTTFWPKLITRFGQIMKTIWPCNDAIFCSIGDRDLRYHVPPSKFNFFTWGTHPWRELKTHFALCHFLFLATLHFFWATPHFFLATLHFWGATLQKQRTTPTFFGGPSTF